MLFSFVVELLDFAKSIAAEAVAGLPRGIFSFCNGVTTSRFSLGY